VVRAQYLVSQHGCANSAVIGGAGGGFAVAVGVQVGADLHFGIDTGATTVTAIDNVVGARDLYGYIKTVEFTNAAIRPDQTDGDDSLTGALPVGTTTGAVVVAGDGVGATDDIYDVVNDVDTIAPATAIIGLAEGDSDLIADVALADDNDLIVYVL
ncbi:MAG TPA: hypothetical protein PLQ87_09075, partial [Phycisphaerae bacterium]|nr:hypothetical protein [Phycisphaerae bacterium]